MSSKIAIITDQHFQARKTSKSFHNYFLKFYEEIFFPYLESNNIKTVIDLGDTFDNRNFLDPIAIDWAKRNYYDRLQSMGIDHHIIVGNHTAKFKNSNKISSVDLILREYNNITIYKEATETIINNCLILFLPWINQENEEFTIQKINGSKAKVVMGHLELNGFSPYVGHVMEDGRDFDSLQKFEKVFSGHYHTRSDNGRIYYVGNPYELYFNDMDDRRGFVIFDPETLVHDYVDNPFRMHYQVFYDGSENAIDVSELEDKIVRVVVKKQDNFKHFDDFISRINNANPMELKIVQPPQELQFEEFIETENEDTFSILNRFIDESDIDHDKGKIKSIINQVYHDVHQLE